MTDKSKQQKKELEAIIKKRKPDLKAPTKEGTKLLKEVLEGDVKGITAALSAKTKEPIINSHDEKSGDTSLHIAAELGYREVVQLLLEKGADTSAINKSGQTPLHVGTKKGQLDIIGLILSHGAKVDAIDSQRKTSLCYAIANQDELCFMRVLDAGADIEADINGNTPLHEAASVGFTRGVQVLLKKGAVVNKKNPGTENTPLHIAAINGHLACCIALLEGGADRDLVNKQGFKARELAIQGGHQELSNQITKFVRSNNSSNPPTLRLPENGPPGLSVPSLAVPPPFVNGSSSQLPPPVNFPPPLVSTGSATQDYDELERQKNEIDKQIAQLKQLREQALAKQDVSTANHYRDQIHELEDRQLEIEEKQLALEEAKLLEEAKNSKPLPPPVSSAANGKSPSNPPPQQAPGFSYITPGAPALQKVKSTESVKQSVTGAPPPPINESRSRQPSVAAPSPAPIPAPIPAQKAATGPIPPPVAVPPPQKAAAQPPPPLVVPPPVQTPAPAPKATTLPPPPVGVAPIPAAVAPPKPEAIPPPPTEASDLPPGWEQRRDDKNRVFFVDHNTKKTVWEHPVTGKRHPDTIAFYEKQKVVKDSQAPQKAAAAPAPAPAPAPIPQPVAPKATAVPPPLVTPPVAQPPAPAPVKASTPAPATGGLPPPPPPVNLQMPESEKSPNLPPPPGESHEAPPAPTSAKPPASKVTVPPPVTNLPPPVKLAVPPPTKATGPPNLPPPPTSTPANLPPPHMPPPPSHAPEVPPPSDLPPPPADLGSLPPPPGGLPIPEDLPLPPPSELPPLDLPPPVGLPPVDLPPPGGLPPPPTGLPTPASLPPPVHPVPPTSSKPISKSQTTPMPMVLPPSLKNSKLPSLNEEDELGEIAVLKPKKLALQTSKPRDKPKEADVMIDKLSGSLGVDKKFWMDFENSVLSELRSTVEEVDPIDWLMSIAESDDGYGKPKNNNNITKSKTLPQQKSELDDLLSTLDEL
eukprot:CAMPEP_0168564146 /NCGR_PEP_ID=MMETSP0413-20121227/13075_1 /TAXON_ID=136452 /ORGANISM="Filamoeba nolandi, Strain NC-AS-23-1" /LENGTH=979 /DNA_ID=CAMNT_0008595769 /DNA_START=183 /DNA_END=3119 /DNA_ORIENTATION=-